MGTPTSNLCGMHFFCRSIISAPINITKRDHSISLQPPSLSFLIQSKLYNVSNAILNIDNSLTLP